MKTDLYVFAGFLFAGKSTLINKLKADNEKILTIALEQGEIELEDAKYFKNLSDAKAYINSIDISKYDKVFMEYNGTMPLGNIYTFANDTNLILRKTVYILDGKTADNYLLNMTTMILEQINYADLIYIRNAKDFSSNRAKEVIKTLKPNIKIIDSQDEIEDLFKEKKSNNYLIIFIVIILAFIIYKFILKQ